MSRLGILITSAVVLLTACDGQSTITPAWKKVDSCLEQHPSFVGNVVVEKGGGGGAIDTLSVEDSGGALVNASRFPSAAAARSAEQGIGPPGPTVFLYGDIALEVNASAPRNKAGAIERCFNGVYGTGTSATSPSTVPTASPATTSPTTTQPQEVTGPLPSTGTRSCDGTVFAGPGTSCDLAGDVFTAWLDALNKSATQTGMPSIPPQVTAVAGTTPLITVHCSIDEAGTVSCTGPHSFLARFSDQPPNTVGAGGMLAPGQHCAADAVAGRLGQSTICAAKESVVTTHSNPPPCNSSHNAYFRCATAAAPYCEQGQCLYPLPASGTCAPGYRRTAGYHGPDVCEKPSGY
jgi:hypothetical protein